MHLLPLADVTVVPSIFPEAFGMVAAEAAAAGRRSLAFPGSAGRARLCDERRQRLGPRSKRDNSSTSTPGGTSTTRSTWPTTSSSTSRMCCDPTNVASADARRFSPPLLELGAAAHRILELGAVRLHAEALAARGADGPPMQDVVGEDEVGGQQLAQRCGVRIDVGVPLGLGELLQQARLEARVAVKHEHGQQAPRKLRHHDLRVPEVEVLGNAQVVVPELPGAPAARVRA